VQTKTLFDGLNRVVQEQRQDTDNRIGARAEEFRCTYLAHYNALGQLDKETEYDWCSAEPADDFQLTSVYTYDDWGEQRSVKRPDGVVEHEVTDPIALTTTAWLEGMGKTVTQNNLFEKPDWVKRYALGDEPTTPDVEPLSEHHYSYDGLGRTTVEVDALSRTTEYVYDVFDRMIKTTLPDEAVVERRYALHSTEDLPTWIGVNGEELGQQMFDGIDRMYRSITGGRITEYEFTPGQTQPFKVTRPDAQVVDYVYKPALGEEPLERSTQTGLKAEYVYDGQNARLKSCKENGLTLSREYYSNGEVKSETREGYTMHYHYSRQARLLAYTDVLEQVQKYDYDKSKGQLKSTTLGTTVATFTYNAQGLTESIETQDGAQTLNVNLTYDDLGREVVREFDFGSAPSQTLTQAYNEVDGLVERILEEKETGTVLRHERYGYDVRGRLELYECSGTQPPVDPYGKPIEMQLFMFDELDNLTLVKTYFPDGDNTAEYAYENQADPAQLSRVTNDHEDYLPQVIELTYNPNGELTRDEEGRELDYDVHGRLITVSGLPGESPKSNRYDPLDSLAAQNDESRFYQDGQLNNLIQASNSSTFMRGNGDVLAELKAGADPKSLLLASDDKNSVFREVSRHDHRDNAYSPYGHSQGGEGSLGYNGELRETQVGWYLLGNGYRAYNPLLMRFHSSDSWSPFGEGGLNAYSYVMGNPVGLTDPTGHKGIFVRFFNYLFGGTKTASGVSAGRSAGQGASKGIGKAASKSSDNIASRSKTGAKVSKSKDSTRPNQKGKKSSNQDKAMTEEQLAEERGYTQEMLNSRRYPGELFHWDEVTLTGGKPSNMTQLKWEGMGYKKRRDIFFRKINSEKVADANDARRAEGGTPVEKVAEVREVQRRKYDSNRHWAQ
jgi:RHS repeat-associated protein